VAVFTLSIDTPKGFNTDLFFTGLLPIHGLGGSLNNNVGTGSYDFRVVDDNGVASGPFYTTSVTGTNLDFGAGDQGLIGRITSANLTRTPDGGTPEQLAHLTIALGSNTGLLGGVDIPGVLALTPDTLVQQPARIDTNGAQLNIIGAGGNDRMTASGYKDQLFGNSGNDYLDAKGGADLLNGGAGNDRMFGGSGSDLLFGGLGIDSLTGGAGTDSFVFDKTPASSNRDTILDFSHKDDRIALENEFFRGIAEGTLTAAAFWVGSAAHDASDRIIYNKSNGALYYDRDGTGSAAKVQFATLSGSPDDVTRGDFLII
jgi:Ca2+-binding RTX toxin-like protein